MDGWVGGTDGREGYEDNYEVGGCMWHGMVA